MAAFPLRKGERVLDIRMTPDGAAPGVEVDSLRAEGAERCLVPDAAPEEFTEVFPDQGGEVRVSPMVETLRYRLRRQREK